MAYTLDEFCAESRALLKAGPQATALAQISERLGRLLFNPAFVCSGHPSGPILTSASVSVGTFCEC